MGCLPQYLRCIPKAILKKTSVSGVAAGWFKKVRMGTFFSFLQFFFFFSKNGQYFPTEKKKLRKKKKCGLPTGFKKGHPLNRKQKFLLGWPNAVLQTSINSSGWFLPGLSAHKTTEWQKAIVFQSYRVPVDTTSSYLKVLRVRVQYCDWRLETEGWRLKVVGRCRSRYCRGFQ